MDNCRSPRDRQKMKQNAFKQSFLPMNATRHAHALLDVTVQLHDLQFRYRIPIVYVLVDVLSFDVPFLTSWSGCPNSADQIGSRIQDINCPQLRTTSQVTFLDPHLHPDIWSLQEITLPLLAISNKRRQYTSQCLLLPSLLAMLSRDAKRPLRKRSLEPAF